MAIAATNRADFLDPALTRSGRFDAKIEFDLPDKNERKELFNYYLGKMARVQKNIDMEKATGD
mgnify:CR=1 FL=1